jgi:AbrB family looped-hinge helix DNA binding protein
MKTVVSEKGQVTIPKVLRDRLGILPGQILDFVEEHGTLIARKITPVDPLDELYGIVSLPAGTDGFLAELRDPADR